MTILIHFLLSLGAVFGFCSIFKIPKKAIVPCMIIGAAGWAVFKYVVAILGMSNVLGCLFGALVVAALSEACARIFKDASTIFVLPGILPLVPGAGMYYTMRALIAGDYATTISTGTNTIFMAGAIAVAILIVTSLFRVGMVIRGTLSPREFRR